MKYFLIFLIISFHLSAQQKFFKCTLLNFETNDFISNANIKIDNSDITIHSDNKGKFIFFTDSIENGITITIVGYAKKYMQISELKENSENIIYLKPILIPSQTILISGTIAEENKSPISYSNISKNTISNEYTIQDIPEFLSGLPSITYYTESGNNTGYSYLNIRGFDQRRISVAVNGIPQNDPEDHNVYWVDFPDLLSSTDFIQVQRGAGAGLIGYPSIGGSVNIITSSFSESAKLKFETSIANYNSKLFRVSYSTGILDNKYSVLARLSNISSDGYRNSAWTNLNSFYFSFHRFDEDIVTQINFYGGLIKDGLVYNGLAKFSIKDKNLRKENLSYWQANENEYLYKSIRRNEESEKFFQPHFEILNEIKINDDLLINSNLFYVFGEGYYDYDASWADTNYFRLTNKFGFTPSSNPTNSLIRASVENNQFGWLPKLNYKAKSFELIIGGEFRFHSSKHWGNLISADNLPTNFNSDYNYYEYKGRKDIINFYLHVKLMLSEKLNILVEIQTAYFKYRLFDEKFINYDLSIKNIFLNPKVGINYSLNKNLNAFASFARVSREPRLKNYYDAAESSGGENPQFETFDDGGYNFSNPLVKPETINNLEIGTSFVSDISHFSVNFYYMYFENEIVKNGKLDRFGQPKTGNAKETIHTGIEISATYFIFHDLEFSANFTYSKNYIKNSYEFIAFNKSIQKIDLSSNPISGFPDLLLNFSLKYNSNNFFIKIDNRFVGKYYSDNYGNRIKEYISKYPDFIEYSDNVVEPYFVSNFIINYKFEEIFIFKDVKLGFQINNLFDNLYAINAYGKEFFPSAERNYLINLQVGL